MKKLLALLLALSMVLALAACSNNQASNPGTSNPGGSTQDRLENQENQDSLGNSDNIDNEYIKDEITIADKTATSLTNWGTNNGTPGNYSVYEMLYECDFNGEMYPLLADAAYEGSLMAGCDHEPGSGVYTVKIYDYIKDHWGNPVTASDVAFSYMYQFENETTSGWGDLISVEAADPTTVVFTFSEDQDGVGELLNIFARCFIVTEKAFNDSKSNLVDEMCGTGPYKFDNYVSGSTLTLVRNEDYWQTNEDLLRQEQRANVNKITYQFIDEAAQRVVALKTGAVDYVHEMAATSAVDFADGGEFANQFNVYTYRAKFVYYLTPNCSSNSLLNDINLRLAVFNAIDQDGLITALGGTNTRIHAYVSFYDGFYDSKWVDWESKDNYNTRTSVDPAQVQEYLSAAGYNGQKLIMIANGPNATAAEVIAAQLAALNINVEVQSLDNAAYNAARNDPTAFDLDFGQMAGSEMATVWLHGFSYDNMDGTMTNNFVVNDEWNDLLNEICTEDGHTPENMEKWWDIAVENAYTMGMFNGNTYDVIPEDMTYVCLGDKQTPLLGACTYAAP